jgi:D-tagatose-1,6-bisphosphate aldolase subunit GatZ/KbaZ
MTAMEKEMLANPAYWQSHYRGDPDDQRVLRHFSYSDRIRYYWAAPAPQEAVRRLLDRLMGTGIPEPLISQFLPTLYPRVASGTLDPVPRTLVLEAVRDILRVYAAACGATRAARRLSAPVNAPL